MKAIRWLGAVILISGFLLNGISEVIAEQKTLTTTIFITVRESPKDMVSEDQNFSNYFDSQMEGNPESVPEIKVEKLLKGKGETSRYTIYEKL